MRHLAALVVVLVLCAASVHAIVHPQTQPSLTERDYQAAFLAWTQQYDKTYSSAEFTLRFNNFKFNLDFVNQWNAKGSSTVLGTNILADLSNDEYRKLYLGTHFDGTSRLSFKKKVSSPSYSAPRANPASVDWVAKGAVTAIKNQGACGSCWSFSTTGSVEGINFITNQKLVSLSEQNLMDCSTSYGNAGCDGGLMDDAFKYIIANKGIDTEASYPYTMATEACKFTVANIGATINSYKDVTAGSEADLEIATVQQPVSVAIDASQNSFQLYKSGVYDEPKCSSKNLDHGVLSVGYGVTNTSVPYWYVKNSWGTDWGMAGYIWMSKNKHNQCGIATMASYPIITPSMK